VWFRPECRTLPRTNHEITWCRRPASFVLGLEPCPKGKCLKLQEAIGPFEARWVFPQRGGRAGDCVANGQYSGLGLFLRGVDRLAMGINFFWTRPSVPPQRGRGRRKATVITSGVLVEHPGVYPPQHGRSASAGARGAYTHCYAVISVVLVGYPGVHPP
jgi:hypothetical protein